MFRKKIKRIKRRPEMDKEQEDGEEEEEEEEDEEEDTESDLRYCGGIPLFCTPFKVS